MSLEKLVHQRDIFSTLSEESGKIIYPDRRLPGFVFKNTFDKYLPMEYEYVNRPHFPALLKELSDQYNDERVNYVTIEPDPVKYYLDVHGFYGMASFRPIELAEAYFPTMSRGNRADSFLHRGGDVGLFWGTSLAWAVYCDRISWEIAILAINGDFSKSESINITSLSPVALSEYILSQYSQSPSVAREFVDKFLANYNSR